MLSWRIQLRLRRMIVSCQLTSKTAKIIIKIQSRKTIIFHQPMRPWKLKHVLAQCGGCLGGVVQHVRATRWISGYHCDLREGLGISPVLCVWSLHVLPVSAWVYSECFGFLLHSKDMIFGQTGKPKLYAQFKKGLNKVDAQIVILAISCVCCSVSAG